MDDRAELVEVGPRDGLQNEPVCLPPSVRAALVDQLAQAGLRRIEAGAFVSPRAVPQMAHSEEVFAQITRRPGVRYAALVPNLQGFERALASGADEVAVFAAASETFSQRNINCSIAESLDRFRPVLAAATTAGVPVRGYVSCVLGCPYEGEIEPKAVVRVATALADLGCGEISLGDTIGVGTPETVRMVFTPVTEALGANKIAGHFHDTGGQAVANLRAALDLGIRVFDSAVGGLGGCPFAPDAPGNLATEAAAAALTEAGLSTSINLDALVQVSEYARVQLGRLEFSILR